MFDVVGRAWEPDARPLRCLSLRSSWRLLRGHRAALSNLLFDDGAIMMHTCARIFRRDPRDRAGFSVRDAESVRPPLSSRNKRQTRWSRALLVGGHDQHQVSTVPSAHRLPCSPPLSSDVSRMMAHPRRANHLQPSCKVVPTKTVVAGRTVTTSKIVCDGSRPPGPRPRPTTSNGSSCTLQRPQD